MNNFILIFARIMLAIFFHHVNYKIIEQVNMHIFPMVFTKFALTDALL